MYKVEIAYGFTTQNGNKLFTATSPILVVIVSGGDFEKT